MSQQTQPRKKRSYLRPVGRVTDVWPAPEDAEHGPTLVGKALRVLEQANQRRKARLAAEAAEEASATEAAPVKQAA